MVVKERYKGRSIKATNRSRDYGRKYAEKRRADPNYRFQQLLYQTQARARKRNIENNLTLDYIIKLFPIDGKCPVFGFKLEWNNQGFRETSPSLDRIDNTKGYIKGNIQMISWKANRLKNNFTLEDLEKLVAFMQHSGD